MKRLEKCLFLFLGVFFICPAAAAEGDVNLISLFGKACEAIKPGEAKSSVRVRATDKASFKSVENLSELSSYRDKLSAHDFNVLVYGIVDNYIEDLSVKTTKQDEEEICVETTGFLHSENILKAIDENYQKFAPQAVAEETPNNADYPQALDIEDENALVPAVTPFPPAPELTDAAPAASTEQPAAKEEKKEVSAATSGLSKVFIEKTKFFNGMTTNAYFDDLKNIVLQKQGITITQDKNSADYILSPEVLRAKVDAINNQTNRLQMVVSLELFNVQKESSIKEHQNRFILFESKEDEQTVASSLMKKLFAQAGNVIVNNISTKTPGALMNRDAIITPAGAEKIRRPQL